MPARPNKARGLRIPGEPVGRFFPPGDRDRDRDGQATGEPVGKATGEPVGRLRGAAGGLYFGFTSGPVEGELTLPTLGITALSAADVTRALGTLEVLVAKLRSDPQRVADYLHRSAITSEFSGDLAGSERFAPIVDAKELGRLLYIIGGLAVASLTEDSGDA